MPRNLKFRVRPFSFDHLEIKKQVEYKDNEIDFLKIEVEKWKEK